MYLNIHGLGIYTLLFLNRGVSITLFLESVGKKRSKCVFPNPCVLHRRPLILNRSLRKEASGSLQDQLVPQGR